MADDNTNGRDEKPHKINLRIHDLYDEMTKLNTEDNPLALRLLDAELKKTKDSGNVSFDNRFIDVFNDRLTKVTCRVQVPTTEFPTYNFVGKLLGPKGHTLRHLQEHTKCKMLIFGRGSMRDKAKEDELRASGDVKYSHLSNDLHVEVSCVAPPGEAYTRIAHALQELRLVLIPDNPMDETYGFLEDYSVMHPASMAPPASESKAMNFIEKARKSMDRQPSRRYGHSSRGHEEPYYGNQGWSSGYRSSSRSAPYSRP